MLDISPNNNRSFVIVSSNKFDQFLDALELHNIGHKLLIGCYKRELEQSVIISYDDWLRDVRAWSLVADQESALILTRKNLQDGHRYAFLQSLPGTARKYLGTFKPITPKDLIGRDSWTLEENGQHWGTEL